VARDSFRKHVTYSTNSFGEARFDVAARDFCILGQKAFFGH